MDDEKTTLGAEPTGDAPVSPEPSLEPSLTTPPDQGKSPEPAEQKPVASSPVDLESLKAEIRREFDNRQKALEEELKRTRQSFRDTGDSIVQRVRDEYQKRKTIIDDLEKDGTITQDVAAIKRAQLRDSVEDEVITSSRGVEQPGAQGGGQGSADYYAQARQYVQTETTRIWNESGLAVNDPEFKTLPTELPPGNPVDAVEIYRDAVSKAKAAKTRRLHTEEKTAQEARAQAQKTAPLVDTGAGGASGISQETLVTEMQTLLRTTPKDAADRLRIKKRMDEIEAALAK